MEQMLQFDICALIIIAILIISTLFRGIYRGKTNRIFFFLLFLSLFTTAFDIMAVALDDAGSKNTAVKYIVHSMYLLLHNFAAPLYIAYVIALSDTWHIVKKHSLMLILYIAPIFIDIVLLAVNPIIHKLFYFDAQANYHRGALFPILYIGATVYFVAGLLYLISCRKLFSMKKFSSLFAVYPLIFFATLIQMIYPDILIEMFANAVSLLYIALMIRRPEEMIESSTGFQKIDSYVKDMDGAAMTKKQLKIIMINITNFEPIRKMLGYENTHIMLKKISGSIIDLTSMTGLNAELYYLGQGKFRVVASTAFDKVSAIAAKINNAFKPNININQMAVNLMACVCVVNFPEDIGSSESLIAFGNELDGRYYNGSVLYAADIYQHSRYEIMKDIDRIIEHALTNNEFEVYYQPIYSVEEHRFTTAEALLRLHTADGKFISPDIFIPAAEKSGAIHKIGAFVLDEVCRFISDDIFKKLHLQYIEVNLSVTQCMQVSLANDILSVLDKYKIASSAINLEITETAASYSQNTMMNNLNILSDAGIHLSLDDFGTGYSNMVRIASLPLHIVKLDKTFSDIAQTSGMNVVLRNTIRMIKEMNMQIVVEGVETAELADKFSELKCEYIQGYYYSKPMPKNELIKFLMAS